MIVATTKTKIGPRHHGRKMSLRKFEFAEIEEGYLVELARGYVVVGEVANYFHAMQIEYIRNILGAYKLSSPQSIHAVLDGSSSKLLIFDWESERHPDIAIYLSPPPENEKNRKVWRTWIPDIVVEVVSPSSDSRDYTEKRDEYWTLGAKEYWIVDARREQIVKLHRGRTQWKETILGSADVCESKLLPGCKLSCAPLFALVAEGDEEG